MTADIEPADERWLFLHTNDSHMGTPRSYRFRPAVNKRWAAIKEQMAATGADLLLHGGDLTRDGDTHQFEYRQARADLDSLPFPSFVIPGNMDVGNKRAAGATHDGNDPDIGVNARRLDLFSSYFGPVHWTFLHRGVRFTGLYAAVAGSGLPHEERMWSMLERLPELPGARQHVAVMHYWPFLDSPDEPAWEVSNEDEYHNWYFTIDPPHRQRLLSLFQAAGVEILFCGHVHTGRPVQVVDGLRIYRTSAAGNTPQLKERWPDAEVRQGFHRCTVSSSGIEVAFVPGAAQCEEFDAYGPMGHPRVAERDYSAAREKPPLQPDPGAK